MFHLFCYQEDSSRGGVGDYVDTFATYDAAVYAAARLPRCDCHIAVVGTDGRLHVGWYRAAEDWQVNPEAEEFLPKDVKDL